MSKKRESLMSPNSGLELKKISPKTSNQSKAFEAYEDRFNIVMHGWAGSGKTFLALYFALREIRENPKNYYKIVIIRSSVPSRDMGFLPGNLIEKAAVYEEPYENMVNELHGRGDAYGLLKKRGTIEFRTTSYLRGITFDNSIVIVDEIQNMTFHELDTIMTRMGDTTRIIFCGDYRQTDLIKDREKVGLHKFLDILDNVSGFDHIEFGINDIVRSDIVKEYIIAKENDKEKGDV